MLICNALGLKALGMILLIVFALLGYGVGTVKIPRIVPWKFTKNIEGDSIDEIVIRYIKFKINKKVYTYTKEEE